MKHESYDANTLENDLAIIKLRDKVELNENVQLTCLPDKHDFTETYPEPNQYAWAAGWGTSGKLRPLSPVNELKNMRLDVYNMSMCSGILKLTAEELGKYAFCGGLNNFCKKYQYNKCEFFKNLIRRV